MPPESAAGRPLHLCLALPAGQVALARAGQGPDVPPGPLPGWLTACMAAWRADRSWRFSVWPVPDQAEPPGAAAPVPQPAVDVWLLLDHRLQPALPAQAQAVRCWLLVDLQARALDPHRPLLEAITGQRGLGLQLLEHTGPPGSAAWLPRRVAHWPASSHHRQAVAALPAAVQQLVQQAVIDLQLGLAPAGPAQNPAPAPAPGALARLACRWRGRLLAAAEKQRQRWLSEFWRIGVVDAPAIDWLRSGGRLPVRWITRAESEGYWADPMGMVGDDRQLFCEYFDEASGHGHLEAMALDANGQVAGRTRLSVGDGAHVSFPLVVEIDGRRLGVAEAAATRECLLYEVDASGGWRAVGTLLRGVSAADPALFAWEGRYWLAFTDLKFGAMDNLCLYHADQLAGPWLPHANNPVKIDITGARMAGGLFSADGHTYRPAQDCLKAYGQALTVHRIVRCTPTEFVEERVAHILPDPQGACPDGLHTLSAWGNRTLIDGKRLGFNPLALRRKLRERLRHRGAPPMPPVPPGAPRPPLPPMPPMPPMPPGPALAALAASPVGGLGSGVRRVAVYIPHLRLGGGETSLLRLAGGLARAGVAVDLVVHTMATAELAVPRGVQLHELGVQGTAAAVRRLVALLRRQRPQCLLSGFPHTNLAAIVAVALAGVGCRCVLSEHAPLSRQIQQQGGWRYKLLPPLVRWAYRRADAVVAVSAGVRDDLRRLIGQGLRLQVIANPVLPEPDPAALDAQVLHPWLQDRALRVVLSVSRLSVEKDIPTLLRAFAQLHRRQPETRLLLAGDGPERAALLAQVQAMGLAEVVQLPGQVKLPMAWMRRAAVFALASQYEGFGNVLVEALASGVPVVSTDCPVGPREILEGGRFGALVPVGDAAAMAQALGQAMAAGQPPAGAQAHALQFTEARACSAYHQLFDALVQGTPC